MRRLLVSMLAMVAIHAAGCGGTGEEELSTPSETDKTQAGPVDGPRQGTRKTYFSDASLTTVVGQRESGCPPSTSMINWGVTSSYFETMTFFCYQEPQE
ncbi:DUF6289 family protein [Stigmatella erecta]|uniref:Secreted protein n=1 Tax=Stigmatella erecta TaxID=83460 RepID=A0A1I0GSI9_9BACT|nr:DUF6289 family protein [Stigmatella erecta]SET74062.1 hypothetical protein SAMN05443639_104143 [Stigmatella erecta]